MWKVSVSAPDPLTPAPAVKMVDMALISHASVALRGAKKEPDQEARMRHRKFENDGEAAARGASTDIMASTQEEDEEETFKQKATIVKARNTTRTKRSP